jgi:hyperosmotically inducible periplasmic protein
MISCQLLPTMYASALQVVASNNRGQRYKFRETGRKVNPMKTKCFVALMAVLVTLSVTSAPLHASAKDDQIESSAKKSYVFKTYLKDDEIKINSKDGVVTLTGTVSEESNKSLAEETVAALPGVKKVDNKLAIKGERPADNSDAWVLAKVKAALLFRKNVSALQTDVDVKSGIVTLRGEAASGAQRDLTTEYVKDIEGVKDVKNEMTVSGSPAKKETLGEKIDDASTTAQVKSALLLQRSTSALRTKVDTKNGVVTLTGRAENSAEKDLVTKVVSDIKGVRKVNNKMTIGKSR